MEANAQANLPLTETTFFIMLSLAQEPKHGYAIMKEVQELSEKRVKLSTSTLYGAVKRLLTQEWIERVDEEGAGENGRARKAYRLSTLGERILSAEVRRLEALVATAQREMMGARA
jgi:DNA-binding PadR family transcriptional regulator